MGDFGELGPESTSIHQQLGRDARTAGVNRLFTVGQQSKLASAAFGDNARHFNDKAELEAELKRILTKDVACLIKGSRFMKLDQLADALAVGGEA